MLARVYFTKCKMTACSKNTNIVTKRTILISLETYDKEDRKNRYQINCCIKWSTCIHFLLQISTSTTIQRKTTQKTMGSICRGMLHCSESRKRDWVKGSAKSRKDDCSDAPIYCSWESSNDPQWSNLGEHSDEKNETRCGKDCITIFVWIRKN